MYLNRQEVAKKVGVRPNTISSYQKNGKLPKPDKIDKIDGYRKVFYWKIETVDIFVKERNERKKNIEKAKSEKEEINNLLDDGVGAQEVAEIYSVNVKLINSLKKKAKKPTCEEGHRDREFEPPRYYDLVNQALNQTIKA